MRRTALIALCFASVAGTGLAGTSSAQALTRHGPTSQVRIVRTPDGPVIANAQGMTLYVYVDDLLTAAASACVGDCDNDWWPAFAKGKVSVAKGISGHIATVERFGQGHQLTMDGRPLYTFSGDTPGELRGNGVGNLWWAMTPSGLAATSFSSERSTYAAPAATTLTVVQTTVGEVVANSKGQVVYDYADDTPTTSACTWTSCVPDWPPLTVTGHPSAGPGITAALAVIGGPDGVRQLTLVAIRFYTFVGDLHPGDIRGQGIGSDWYLLSPSGTQVTSIPGSK